MKKYIVEVDAKGTKQWFNLDGQNHREDGPAIEWANGDKWWEKNGAFHRVDGPAIETIEGNKHWFLNGKLHREDGPAVEFAGGAKHWYLNGTELTEEEFNARNKPYKELTLAQLESILGFKIKIIS